MRGQSQPESHSKTAFHTHTKIKHKAIIRPMPTQMQGWEQEGTGDGRRVRHSQQPVMMLRQGIWSLGTRTPVRIVQTLVGDTM